MKLIHACLCALPILWTAAPARAQDNAAPAASDYRRVMQAQYAAKEAPKPARPEEAQRIYDAYLKSIGQRVKDHDLQSGGNAGQPSR